MFTFAQLRSLLPDADDVHGWYDYATGLVGLSVTHDQVAAVDDPAATARVRLSAMHEHAHAVQRWSMPFFALWCRAWEDEVRGTALRLQDQFRQGRLGPGMREMPDDDPALRTCAGLLARLEHRARGVSVRRLLEGQATYVEARCSAGIEDPTAFWHFLADTGPDHDYRACYDLLRLWWGDDAAFETFGVVTSASLASSSPETAFWAIVETVTRDEITPGELDLAHALALVRDRLGADAVLGEPFAITGDEPWTRTFSGPYVAATTRWAAQVPGGPDAVVRDVRRWDDVPAVPGVVFSATDTGEAGMLAGNLDPWHPEHWSGATDDDDRRAHAFLAALHAAVSQGLLRRSSAHVRTIDERGAAWWATIVPDPRDIVVNRRALLAAKDPGSDEADALARLVGGLIARCHAIEAPGTSTEGNSAFLRRLRLSFEETLDGPVWTDPVVRDLVVRLSTAAPHLPVFLDTSASPRGWIGLWFGSLVPEAILSETDGSLDVAHPAVVAEVERLLVAAVRAVEGGDVDVLPALAAFLAPLGGVSAYEDMFS